MKSFADLTLITGGVELLDRILPLWESMRKHHGSVARHFAEEMRNTPWDLRRRSYQKYADNGKLIVEIVIDPATGTDIGFSVSVVEEDLGILWGSLESLYIEPEWRSSGVGGELTRRSVEWLKTNHCERIGLCVAEGNERVIGLYRRFGFEIRTYELQLLPGR